MPTMFARDSKKSSFEKETNGVLNELRPQLKAEEGSCLKNDQKLNPGTACPATWWMASKDVDQNALTFVQVEHGESPLKAVSGLMRSQNADTREGYAEIPTRGLTILKGQYLWEFTGERYETRSNSIQSSM